MLSQNERFKLGLIVNDNVLKPLDFDQCLKLALLFRLLTPWFLHLNEKGLAAFTVFHVSYASHYADSLHLIAFDGVHAVVVVGVE